MPFDALQIHLLSKRLVFFYIFKQCGTHMSVLPLSEKLTDESSIFAHSADVSGTTESFMFPAYPMEF